MWFTREKFNFLDYFLLQNLYNLIYKYIFNFIINFFITKYYYCFK